MNARPMRPKPLMPIRTFAMSVSLQGAHGMQAPQQGQHRVGTEPPPARAAEMRTEISKGELLRIRLAGGIVARVGRDVAGHERDDLGGEADHLLVVVTLGPELLENGLGEDPERLFLICGGTRCDLLEIELGHTRSTLLGRTRSLQRMCHELRWRNDTGRTAISRTRLRAFRA